MLSDSRFAVFGGRYYHANGGFVTTGSCEALVLDNGAERWEPLPPMLEARADCASAAVGGCVIVAGGGDDNNTILSSAEVYEEAGEKEEGAWRRLPCDLPRGLAGMGSALL